MPLEDRLIHTVTIERRTVTGTKDDYNQSVPAWSTLVSGVPAWVQPLSVQEQRDANGAGPVIITHRVYMMPRDIKASDRLRFNGMAFGIDSVLDPANRGKHFEVMAHQVTT
jgi:head-tail adaptor